VRDSAEPLAPDAEAADRCTTCNLIRLSGLDYAAGGATILSALDLEIAAGACAAAGRSKVVMATHDIGEARRLAGDVVFLLGGRLVEHAPAPRFLDHPATCEARRFLAGDLVLG
jgi:ABC-type proline/glycine betaine transport system ATPase subunit